MLNQIVLVGRLVSKPELNGENCEITLAVPRSYKNEEGVYETDYIKSQLHNEIARNTCEYCKKGDLVGVKGRVQSTDNEIEIITEKLTFLSSRSKGE